MCAGHESVDHNRRFAARLTVDIHSSVRGIGDDRQSTG